MRLVKQYTSVPIPLVIFSDYEAGKGTIGMSFIPDYPLKFLWDRLDERDKERLCREIWSMITQWRQIPRPPKLFDLYQCLADGSPATKDPLLKDLDDPPKPLCTEEALRDRIHQRYLRYAAQRYADTLPSMLPRSNVSVFHHGDIAPRNIMVDESGHITGIIDWELAGWYPDYWEYRNIMKPSMDDDWQVWMNHTAPQQWDLTGIVAARRVLF
ncbi:hypothetical protein MMC11_005769 [Xylographa trunciseda]|nr:hypothetical protein [Xylographa trunciseda]